MDMMLDVPDLSVGKLIYKLKTCGRTFHWMRLAIWLQLTAGANVGIDHLQFLTIKVCRSSALLKVGSTR